MNKITINGKLAKQYLKKYPKLPILTLAKLMYAENDMHFNSIEHARSLLKQHAGLGGKETRKNVDPELQRPITYNYAPFNDIPKSYKSGPNDFVLPNDANHILVLSDIHFPYHDEEALGSAIQYGIQEQVNTVILDGDILDFYNLSRFDKHPSKPKMQVELEQGRWFMKALRTAFPKARIYYKIGNHEDRLEKWLMLKAPEWIGTDEFELKMLLRFGENQIELIDSNATIIHYHLGYLKDKSPSKKRQNANTNGCLFRMYGLRLPSWYKGLILSNPFNPVYAYWFWRGFFKRKQDYIKGSGFWEQVWNEQSDYQWEGEDYE